MGTPLSYAAGAASTSLEDMLKQKFLEQIQRAKLSEEIRKADMQNANEQRQLGQGDRRIGLDERQLGESTRQFNEQAPLRLANVGHIGAETASLNRQPGEAQKTRDFSAGEGEKQRTFTGGQGDLNRGNAVRIAGINGQNALAVANVRHPDTAGAAATQKEQNEIDDSLALIDEIKHDKALSTATGPIDARGVGMMMDLEGVTRVKALHDNLVNKLQLAQAGKLKGQGAISNMEREMLKNAATALDLKLGDPDYLTQLDKVRTQFERMRGTAPAGPRAPATGGKPSAVDLIRKYGGG